MTVDEIGEELKRIQAMPIGWEAMKAMALLLKTKEGVGYHPLFAEIMKGDLGSYICDLPPEEFKAYREWFNKETGNLIGSKGGSENE